MRILHVHKYFHDQDGASRYMVELMRLQEQAGHTVAPFAMHESRNIPSFWGQYFVSALDTTRVRGLRSSLKQFGRALWSEEAKRKFAAMVKAYRPEIVHLHNIYTHLSPSILSVCRHERIPVVMTVHDYALVSANYALWSQAGGNLSPTASLFKVARTKCIKNSWVATLVLESIYRLQRKFGLYDQAIKVYLAPSQFVKNILAAAGYREEKVQVLPLFAGNLISSYHLPPTTYPQREGVLFAGRLEERKGADLLVKAAAKFKQTNFYLAGLGPLGVWLQAQAQVYKNLKVLGFVKTPRLWQKMSEVLLLVAPSRSPETFGLAALEAMALGTPVLVSQAGGLAEKVQPEVTGWVCQANDPADFLAKLSLALENPQRLAQMGEAARAYALNQADPKQHVDKVLKVYQAVSYPHSQE